MKSAIAIFLSSILLSGCVPNIGRTNARLTNGWSFSAGGESEILLGGHGTTSDATEKKLRGGAQLNLQKAWADEKDGHGFALQLKLPIGTGSESLDAYYQFTPFDRDFFGVGAEIGMYASGYAAYSHYFTHSLFLTFTPRVHFSLKPVNGRNTKQQDSLSRLVINPQVSFGGRNEDGSDFSLVVGYSYFPGLGLDVHDGSLKFSDNYDKTKSDLHNHDIYFGGMFTF